jgi:hypothetical protein
MALTRGNKIGLGVAGGVVALSAVAFGTGFVPGSEPGGDPGPALSGPAADQARAAALTAIPGGKAGEVRSDNANGAAYDVQVTNPSGGSSVVRLDRNDTVMGSQPASAPDGGDGDDDGG